jgi:riboflavin synthase
VFTGIIEKTVRVIETADGRAAFRLVLPAPWRDLRRGESIAVNGCCLTIARLSPARMSFDIVDQTKSVTNLTNLKPGDEVHLERALRLGDRLDGHFVQGHVDGPATLLARKTGRHETRLTLRTTASLARYITPQGSVALDGVSLTVAAVKGGKFEVALIPTTLKLTAVNRRPIGYAYNLETDVLAKTISFLLEHRRILRQSSKGR